MSFIVSEYWTLIGADEARVLQIVIVSYYTYSFSTTGTITLRDARCTSYLDRFLRPDLLSMYCHGNKFL